MFLADGFENQTKQIFPDCPTAQETKGQGQGAECNMEYLTKFYEFITLLTKGRGSSIFGEM